MAQQYVVVKNVKSKLKESGLRTGSKVPAFLEEFMEEILEQVSIDIQAQEKTVVNAVDIEAAIVELVTNAYEPV